jgi:hypothetical protein
MSDEQTTTDEPTGEPQEGDGQTFDADYVKKLRAEAAKYRTEAKANADAAKKLTELEEAQKSETQKLADRVAKAEQDAEAARREALRYRVAAKFQVSDEDAELFLTGTDEDTLTKQAQRLTERAEQQKKNGNHVPREGAAPAKPVVDERAAFAAFLTGRGEPR